MFDRVSIKSEVFGEKVFLNISQNLQENIWARASFSKKLQASALLKKRLWHRCSHITGVFTACNFIKKEILSQVFSCEFCEISKKTYSYRTPSMATLHCMVYMGVISIF